MGRPSKFTPEVAHTAATLAKLGFTDERLAEALGISRSTLSLWKSENEDFSATLKAAKGTADAAVVNALFQRATGYQAPDGTHIPPHPTAIVFWLKNRAPAEWRDTARHEVSGPDGQPLTGPPMLELPPPQADALQRLIQSAQDRVRRPNLITS